MIKSKQALIALFLIAFFILTLPYFFRLSNNNHIFIGSEPHYHARIASEIADNGLIKEDPLSKEKYRLNPYHILFALASFILPVELASIFLPIILGTLSILFLYLSFSDIKFKYLRSLFVLLVFVFSPMFISVFSLSTPRALITFLLILGFYLFQKKSRFYFALSLVILTILPFFGISHSVITLIILLAYCLHNKKHLPRFYIALILVLFVIAAFHLPYYLTNNIEMHFYNGIISDIGIIYGFSIFSLLLSVIGLFFVWRYKKKLYKVYLLMLALLLFSFLTKSLFIYSNLIVSILAGSAFYVLYVKKWHLKQLRNFALLVIFCGFLFSALSHSVILSELPPNDDLVECLEWINEKIPESSRVFAHDSDGFFIEFWAEKEAVSDSSNIIWNSFDIRETKRVLSEKKVDYLLIHEDLFKGLVWDKKQQGLHFLLDNAETFKRRYHNDYCEVWKYSQRRD